MNQTVNISLGGHLLEIQHDAYLALRKYLEDIAGRFEGYPDKTGLLADIEVGIAEKLKEILAASRMSVVSDASIAELISTMGSADDIAEGKGSAPKEPVRPAYSQRRRLFRDPDNKVIAGVCSGLAAYFGVDTALVRVIFLLLFFVTGSSVVLYPILWIAVPYAKTPAQKAQMHAGPISGGL